MAEASGIKDPETFFTNPEGYEPPPPQPSVQELQIESYERVEKYKADVKAKTENRKIEADSAAEKYKTDENTKVKNNELIYKYQDALVSGAVKEKDRVDSRREKALSRATGKQ